MVRSSSLFVCIVGETVTDAMHAELEEAVISLGPARIFYYFLRGPSKRDAQAEELWNRAKNQNVLTQPNTPEELKMEIRRSIASYIEDVMRSPEARAEIPLDKSCKLTAGSELHYRFEFKKGEEVTFTVISDEPIFAGLFSREEYASLRSGSMFGFAPGTDCRTITRQREIETDDDYYLVLRRTMWGFDASISLRLVRRPQHALGSVRLTPRVGMTRTP